MPRVKRGVMHSKRRRNILERAKGFKWGRKKLIKLAQTAIRKAGGHSYRDRRVKKRTRRALWQVQINAAARMNETTYSRLMDALKKADVAIDRKILATVAKTTPDVFAKIVKQVSK